MSSASASSSNLYIGLMSGTSLNSVDCALVSFNNGQAHLKHSLEYPLPSALRQDLLLLCSPGEDEIHRMAIADRKLGQVFANAVNALLDTSGISASCITAIGSHGQTIRHKPSHSNDEPAYSLQIGDPNTISALTGIPVVGDFRRRDIALGGQGAPLAPAFHQSSFHSQNTNRCIVNIGGISNITLLPHKGSPQGFDTGPGNVLMDTWIAREKGVSYDANGDWAASGQVNDTLLQMLLEEPYLAEPPPKSTGRELFNAVWLDSHLAKAPLSKPQDIMTTLCEFTALCIAHGVESISPSNTDVFVCGGGAHNTHLMNRLQHHLGEKPLQTTRVLGILPDWVEAVAFAWLAKQAIDGKNIEFKFITGASTAYSAGGIFGNKQASPQD